MKQKNFLFALFMMLVLSATETICVKQSVVDLQLAMRKLWEDHIVYTRNFIISDIANLGDKGPVAQRLLQNQDDIGNAIKPYYGNKIGNKLAELLREHILIAVNVVDDAIAGNTQKFEEDYEAWEDNARDIAKFLHRINKKNWSKKELKEMLFTHLELTTDEVTARLNEDWEADIAAYDENHTHMLQFSDVLTFGIVEQFPKKFD